MTCEICTRCGKCGSPSTAVDVGERVRAIVPRRRRGFGAAVDLGTTAVVARVYDLATGECVRRACALNPQREIAADVMGRVSAAIEGRGGELRDAALDVLRSCFGGFEPDETVVVGNTTMLHLLTGENPAPFAVAPFRATRLFGERVTLLGRAAYLPRCAHAFFGADAMAAALAAAMDLGEGPELLADLGTNGELALWRDGALTVTSVAAGPAFERPGVLAVDLVAAIADGLSSGAVDGTGLLTGALAAGVGQADVRAVQLAKGAVRAGLDVLMERTRTSPAEVKRLTLAGGIGSRLDLDRAARVGLVPPELRAVTRAGGNLAIEGAAAMLLDPSLVEVCDSLARCARHLELGGDAGFADAFVRRMAFGPDASR